MSVILSEAVLNLYAEGPDGLSSKDCEQLREDYGLTEAQTTELQKALGKGDGGFITQEEYNALTGAGFTKTTLDSIRGDNGCAALRRRSLWLSDNVDTRVLRSDYDPETREMMLNELQTMAPVLKEHGVRDGVNKENLADTMKRSRVFDDTPAVRRAAFDTLVKCAGSEDDRLVSLGAAIHGDTKDSIDYFAENQSYYDLLSTRGEYTAYALDKLVAGVSPSEATNVLARLMGRLGTEGAEGDAVEAAIIKLMNRPECARQIAADKSTFQQGPRSIFIRQMLRYSPVFQERVARIIVQSEPARNILSEIK